MTIALDGRLGRIEGRLATPDGKELPSKLSLSLRRSSPAGDHPGSEFELLYFKTLKVGGDGRFRFEDLPPGRYALSAFADPDTGYKADPIPDVEVGPDAKVAGLNVPLRRLVTITGRVVDATSGEGLPGVGVNASLLSGNSLQHADRDETDAQGRYTVHVAPGKILIQPSSTPKGHLGLDTEPVPGSTSLPTATGPTSSSRGPWRSMASWSTGPGKPVEGASVHLVKPNPMGFADGGVPVRTAPDGSFRLEQLDPDDTLPVRARTKEATTDGAVVIRPGKQSGKLTLTLDPKSASRVHGVITDRSGKPVPGATVSLWWGRNYVSEKTRFSGVGSVLEGYKTDSDGHFASTAPLAGRPLQGHRGRRGLRQGRVAGDHRRSGGDHDFGTMRLVGTGARVAGRVVDTAGKPVADATVFNRGDAPEAVSTRTDAGGKFRLDGLFVGGKYVFARKDGYRFTAVRVERDSDDATLTLRRVDETPPAWRPPSRPHPRRRGCSRNAC